MLVCLTVLYRTETDSFLSVLRVSLADWQTFCSPWLDLDYSRVRIDTMGSDAILVWQELVEEEEEETLFGK